MVIPGLVSVTFRNKTPTEICALCEKARLKSIEWGGDIHVPPKSTNCWEIRRISADSGLEICAYGSYYRVGEGLDASIANVETAAELGAPIMRIWCGRKGSKDISANERRAIIDELAKCCQAAEAYKIDIAPEFHGGTLTDTLQSAETLLSETHGIKNLRFYWQPRWDWAEADRLKALELLLPRMAHAHVFTWKHTPDVERLPLSDGADMWNKVMPSLDGKRALLEFVKGDSDAALLRDAKTLVDWCGRASSACGHI